MARFFNPEGVSPPASRFSHGALHGRGRRLVVSGQVGVRPDGTLEEGFAAQVERAFENLLTVVRAAGMEPHHVVKITALLRDCTPEAVATYRRTRERMFGSHAPASTLIGVAGLANQAWLFEVEGEAVVEDEPL